MKILKQLALSITLLLGVQYACADVYCDKITAGQALSYPANAPIPLSPIAPRGALIELFHPGLFDYKYSANKQACLDAINLKGYYPTGAITYIERSPQPGTLKFYGFWKDAPQTDHFYSSATADINYVLANGWVPLPASEEISLHAAPKSGTTPLYRAHFFSHTNAETAHYYSLSWSQIQALQAQGWRYDSVAGYAYNKATPLPVNLAGAQTVQIGRRCEYLSGARPGNCFPSGAPSNYRDFQYNQFSLIANAARILKKNTQTLNFDFVHSRYFQGPLHLAVALRANSNINSANIIASNFYGLGLAIGTFGVDRCASAGHNIAIEAFWPTGNKILPEGCVYVGSLVEGRSYRVALSVHDSGLVGYSVQDLANPNFPVLIASKQLNASTWFPAQFPFPSAQGGYMLIDSGASTGGDYEIDIQNFQTAWQ